MRDLHCVYKECNTCLGLASSLRNNQSGEMMYEWHAAYKEGKNGKFYWMVSCMEYKTQPVKYINYKILSFEIFDIDHTLRYKSVVL